MPTLSESSGKAAPAKAGWDAAAHRTRPSEQRATWAAKSPRERRPPPSPCSGEQPRAASPPKLIPAHPFPVRGARSPRAQRLSLPPETWGAAGHRVWPRRPSHRVAGPGQSRARQGSRLRGGEEEAPPGARRGRRAGPAAARSAMKGSLTSTIHFPFLAAPANRERVVSAHVFLLQT